MPLPAATPISHSSFCKMNLPRVALAAMAISTVAGCVRKPYLQPVPLHAVGTFTHKKSGMAFPDSPPGFTRTRVMRYDPTESDISVEYRSTGNSSGIVVTAYVYPAPTVASGPQPLTEQEEITLTVARLLVLVMHFNRVKEAVRTMSPSAVEVSDEAFTLRQNDREIEGMAASFRLSSFSAGSVTGSHSLLFLFQAGPWLVKYRATYPAEMEGQAKGLVIGLMQDLTIPLREGDWTIPPPTKKDTPD